MAPSPIAFNWGRCKEMHHTEVYGQPVALDGKGYVCGLSRWNSKGAVLEYVPNRDQWSMLPPPPVSYFTIATLKGQLLVVGGEDSTGRRKLTILTFDQHTRQWIQNYPAMPTAPFLPAVIGYQDRLIVAGGWNLEDNEITDINILDTTANDWKTVKPLPSIGGYQAVLMEDNLYLVGQSTKTVLRAHVPTLISGGMWESISDALFYRSSPIAIGNTLLTVGGSDKAQGGKLTTSVQMYVPTTNQWTRVSDLPEPMCGCRCVTLSGVLLVLGGHHNSTVLTSNRYLE